MNEALTAWLMTPEAPGVPLTLEDFLRRPVWHQRAPCRGMGHGAFVRGEKADYGPTRELCDGCPVRQEWITASVFPRPTRNETAIGTQDEGVLGFRGAETRMYPP